MRFFSGQSATVLALLLTLTGGCASTSEEPKSSAAEIEMARQFMEMGDYKRAVATLQSVRRNHPKNPQVANMLGTAYMGIGNFQAAEDSFARSVQLDGSSNDVRLNLAFSQIANKKYDQSRQTLDKIYNSGYYPYMERVHVNYGLSYLEEKRCDLAQPKFKESLRIDPTFATAHFNQGKCYLIQKRYPQAVASFKKAVDFCPVCIEPRLELSRAYYLSGKKNIAIEKLESLLRTKLDKMSQNQAKNMLNEFKR